MTQKLKFQIGILILSIAFVSSSGYALYLSAVNGKQSANLVINKDNIARLELQMGISEYRDQLIRYRDQLFRYRDHAFRDRDRLVL